MRIMRPLIGLLFILASVSAVAQSPLIIAQPQYLGFRSRIPQSALFTPTASGIYRVSVYMVATKTGTARWDVRLSWSDEQRQEETPYPWVEVYPTDAVFYSQGTEIIHAIGGIPVNFSVALTAGHPDVSYDLRFVVEQLVLE